MCFESLRVMTVSHSSKAIFETVLPTLRSHQPIVLSGKFTSISFSVARVTAV